MAVEFQMPKLGLTMEEGTIIEWLVDDGAAVEQGTPVLTIETDKVESEVEASHGGILHITGQPGELFACGERIGWFLEAGEPPPASGTGSGPRPAGAAATPSPTAPPPAGVTAVQAPPQSGRVLASPNARRVAAASGVDLRTVVGTGPNSRIVSEDVVAARAGRSAGGLAGATPAARLVAKRLGVDLGEVAPGGAGGRIERADVERHVRGGAPGAAPAQAGRAATELPLMFEPTERIPLTGMRGTIASRMHGALRDMAQLTLTMDVTMDAVAADRAGRPAGGRPGYTDYVMAAVAGALVEHPVVNSQIADGALNLLPQVNVGLAVALDGGLVVPVVHGIDSLSFDELCAETTRLADAARHGRLARAEVEGATFSVTALGMFGVDAFTPVINPPNTAILGVGRIRDDVAWVDDTPTRASRATLSLTWDHRAFDGVPAARFTASVRDRLEQWGAG